MSKPTLTQNLQTIYTVKNQIKEVIGTDSDLFTEYPSIIENAIENAGGGSGSSVDPFYDTVGFSPELVGETVPYISTTIGDNFQVNEKGGEIDSIEYDYAQDDGNGGTWNVHVLLDSDPYDIFADSQNLDFITYPDLYENVAPIVENAVVTVSEDPKNYDYLITGSLYAWNLIDTVGPVETITENGFVPNNGAAGYDIQVSGSSSQIDPWWGDALIISDAISDDDFPVNGDLLYTTINSDFIVNTNINENIESVEWIYNFDDGNNNTYAIKCFVNTSHNLTGDDTGELDNASNIEQSLEDYPDLYGNIYPTLTEVTMTKSADPQRDGYDYFIEGNLYAWNLINAASAVDDITENGLINNYDAIGFNVNVEDSIVKGIDSHAFVSIRPGLTGLNSDYPYFDISETPDGGEQYVDNNGGGILDGTVDNQVTIHTLISNNFPSWGIDPSDLNVTGIKNFEAYDWDNGRISSSLSDLTCTPMVQVNSSNYDCWVLVEGTLQNDTDVCFKAKTYMWDSMSNMWDDQHDDTLLECMPVVERYEDEYSPYGWSTNYDYVGTYIHLEAGPVRLYFHYSEGDGTNVSVYYNVMDNSSNFTGKWYQAEMTGEITFVDPNSE